jgi:alpha-L-fucosidase
MSTRRLLSLASGLLIAAGALVGVSAPADAAPGDNGVIDDALSSSRTQWWRDDRFGMFIHFGVYSTYKGQYGTCKDAEWIKRTCNIPWSDYEAHAAGFKPDAFDAKAIVAAAKQAGQKYIVITSKHHDGFAMWPSKVNDWNLRDRSGFQRDILAELATEARANGLKFGLYYSIWDWHNPLFTTDFGAYKTQMKAQLKELADSYHPDVLWFDGEWNTDNPTNPWSAQDGEDLEKYVRQIAPSTIVDNRVGKRRAVDGDYGTPEQALPTGPPSAQLEESCMTINNTWGYAEWDTAFKSPTTLARNLVQLTSLSSNFLLNIGPTDTGAISTGQANALSGVGDWMARNSAAIYGGGYTDLVTQPSWGRVIRKGGKLYLVVYSNWGQTVHLTTKARLTLTGARVLDTGAAVTVTRSGDGYDLTPTGASTSAIANVIEADLSVPAATPAGTGTGLKAEFWNNTTFSGTPVVTRTDPALN